MAEKDAKLAAFSSKDMLKKHGEAGTKISYDDRKSVEIVKETKYYKVGDVITPHSIKADALIEAGIAKEVKEKK